MSRVEALDAPPLTPGAVVAPRYEVLAHLSRTGWLDLYDAWSEERECRCVVKVLRPDRKAERRLHDRLVREGRWLQAFTHPHLVRAYETVESPEPFVVLETLTGETLGHLIQRMPGRLSADDLAFLGLHLCSAMHYLHGQGLLHLDIKPANVVVESHRAKVLDLSVARAPGPAPAGVGTFCYLSPEQARGGMLSAAADVWGIGVTMYEAAVGEVPFDSGETYSGSGDAGEWAAADGPAHDVAPEPGSADDWYDWYPQLEERAPSVLARRRLPSGLAAAIDGCLDPDPDARPTIAELTATLDGLLPRGRRDAPPSLAG